MQKKVLYIMAFFSVEKTAFSQEIQTIQLDRPDQTECPFIVPKGFIQYEAGFSFEQTNNKEFSISHPSVLWKYGINSRLELRLITELTTELNHSTITTGLQPITIGFKVNLWEEKKWIPRTSFIAHLTTADWGTSDFKTRYYAPSFRFTMQNTLSKRFSLGYNLGAEWDGETANPTFIYTLTSGFSITEKIGCYVEIYGFVPRHEKSNHRIDGGFTFLLTNDLMLDISGGTRLTKNAPQYYVALGISQRFKIAKQKPQHD